MSRGCGLRQFSWDDEGQVLGSRGTPAAAENRVQEKGRGRERCGGGTQVMKTSFEEVCVSLSREGSRPNPQAQQ